jgi:hypothetical protein
MNVDEFRQIRLSCHLLADSKPANPGNVVAWMGAVQAQDFASAKWALGIRLPGCTDSEVKAAFNLGSFLRIHVLRPTWHFVAPENIRWMVRLSSSKLKAATKSRDRDLEITEELYSKTNQVICKALEGGRHLTRESLVAELEMAQVVVTSARLYHFLMRAEAECLVCSGALDGQNQTYALLDERVPPAMPLNQDESLAKLAKLYFCSHSPATLPDFMWWSGLSAKDARAGLEAIKSSLASEEMDGQTYWIADCAAHADTERLPPAHLLPAFDEYIIGYKDRSTVLGLPYLGKAVSSNGVFRPTIAVDGKIIGLWQKGTDKRRTVTLDFFKQVDGKTEGMVAEAVRRYAAFQ